MRVVINCLDDKVRIIEGRSLGAVADKIRGDEEVVKVLISVVKEQKRREAEEEAIELGYESAVMRSMIMEDEFRKDVKKGGGGAENGGKAKPRRLVWQRVRAERNKVSDNSFGWL